MYSVLSVGHISVFPNPTTDYIKVVSEGLSGLYILDVNGRLIMQIFTPRENERLDLSHLEVGVYYLISENKTVQTSIIKI